MPRGLKDKVALVTGGAQGIGRGIALRLANEGMKVSIADLKEEGLKKTVEELKAITAATYFTCDVSDRQQVFDAVEHTHKTLGGFDVIVNNAGIAEIDPITAVTADALDKIYKINVNSVVWGIQAAAAKFKELEHKGKIINACSIAGHDAIPLLGIYSSTKFAVRGITQAAAQELASSQITVNGYCPGIVGTGMWDTIDQRFSEITGVPKGATWKKYVGSIALGRSETPDDVANLVSFLASDDADYITGQSIIVDGGITYR